MIGEEPCATPFGTSPNPIMTLVAFLGSSISPTIASVAARVALELLLTAGDIDEDAVLRSIMDEGSHVITSFGPGVIQHIKGAQEAGSSARRVAVQLKWGGMLYLNEPQVKPDRNRGSHRHLAQLHIPIERNREVAARCLAAAAAQTTQLAEEEERKAMRCVAQLIQAQMHKLEYKMTHLDRMDKALWEASDKQINQVQMLCEEKANVFNSLRAVKGSHEAASPGPALPSPARGPGGLSATSFPANLQNLMMDLSQVNQLNSLLQ